jgi:hypothetical protein
MEILNKEEKIEMQNWIQEWTQDSLLKGMPGKEEEVKKSVIEKEML